MTTREAIKRLGWRFSESAKRSDKSFRINQDDVKALKTIADYYESESKRQIINNQLFGKMYIYLYGEFVSYYKSGPLDTIAQNELHKLLDKPIRQIVEDVMDRLNISELENVIKTQDIKDFSPMEYEEVSINLQAMINGALNEFSVKQK